MKWFKHETSDRNKVESKLIKAKFGIEGYGIYLSLLEVIGETIEQDNHKDWGHVDQMHDINTLADECCVSVEKLKNFLVFCDEKGIFEKHKGRLFSRLILRRLDEWAERIDSKKNKSEKTREPLGSNSGATRARVEEKRVDKNRVEESKPEASLAYLLKVPQEDLKEFTSVYHATETEIKRKAEKMHGYCQAKGRVYKNYKAFLRNGLDGDFRRKEDVEKEIFKPPESNVTDDQAKKNREKLAEMKAKLFVNN